MSALKNDLNYDDSQKPLLKLYIPKFKKNKFRQKVIVEIVVTGIINKKNKSAKFREEVEWVLNTNLSEY